jgi:hypothetical protein
MNADAEETERIGENRSGLSLQPVQIKKKPRDKWNIY